MTTDHEERMAPDDVMRAVLDYEATLPDAGGAVYELPAELAQLVMPDVQHWDGAEEFEAWRAQQAEWWEAEGRRAAVLEYLSPPACPPPPA